MYKVQKKDGSLQDFDRNKVVSGVLKSGGSNEDGEKVAAAIDAWLPIAAAEGAVKSLDLHTQVLKILRTVNPTAAASFESYKKTA